MSRIRHTVFCSTRSEGGWMATPRYERYVTCSSAGLRQCASDRAVSGAPVDGPRAGVGAIIDVGPYA